MGNKTAMSSITIFENSNDFTSVALMIGYIKGKGGVGVSNQPFILASGTHPLKIEIKEQLDFSVQKSWHKSFDILTFGHQPVQINISGLQRVRNCTGNELDKTISSMYEDYNVHDHPTARLYLTMNTNRPIAVNLKSHTYICAWVGLMQSKANGLGHEQTKYGDFTASFLGVRV